MKALVKTRPFQIKYPRDTPRISRKRDWIDRSEWRKDPQATLEGSQLGVDRGFDAVRTLGSLEQTPYQDMPDMMDRMARVGIKKI